MRSSIVTVLFALLAGPAVGQEHFRAAQGAEGVARGPAAAAIRAELQRPSLTCYDLEKGEVKCRILDRALNADVHYGTISGTDQKAALVSVRWQYDTTGNAVDARAYVFVQDEKGEYALVHSGPMVGLSVSDVVFSQGRVAYRTATLRPNDSRASPTGSARMTIAWGPNKGAAPVDLKAIAAMAPMERLKSAEAFARKVLQVKNDMKFAENLTPYLTPSLRATLSNAWAPGQSCPAYDGDPRAGGAQGLNNIHAITTDIKAKNIELNSTNNQPPFILVDANFRDREMPGTVFRTQVKIELGGAGWLVDDFIVRGKSTRAALKAGIAECGSDAAKKAEAGRL